MEYTDVELKTEPAEFVFHNIQDELNIITCDKNKVLPFIDDSGNHLCYWLHCGCVSLIRIHDKIRTFPVTKRACFGMFGSASFQKHYGLVMDVDSVISCQQIAHAKALFSEKNIWSNVVDMQNDKADEYMSYYDRLSVRDTYQEVCFLIKIMMELPDYVRKQIKLSHFIEQRTSMSRSNLLQIISHLKSKDYINVVNGCLHSVVYLPGLRFW